jgi:hypothetical protein
MQILRMLYFYTRQLLECVDVIVDEGGIFLEHRD